MRHFCEKVAFFNLFGLRLNLDILFEKLFGLWLALT